jgi:hypothetical protein
MPHNDSEIQTSTTLMLQKEKWIRVLVVYFGL